MISAWDIYWVMQLDSIGTAMGLMAFLGVIVMPLLWMAWADKSVGFPLVVPALLTPVWIVTIMLAILLPSTKTAAMMLVLPAVADVASSEAVQREAGELYGIAKDALRELAKPKPAAKPENAK